MKIRKLLATAGVAMALVIAVPSVASAAAKPSEFTDCMLKASELKTTTAQDNAANNCHKATSPILPALNEIVWGGIAFLIVAGVLLKFAFPALKKGLADRSAKIASDIAGAEAARAAAEAEAAEYQAKLAEARSDAGRIIEEARQSAEALRADLVARAEADAQGIRARASEEVQALTARALADLQGRVADLSIELAEKVVEHNLDHDTQIALIEGYINSVGTSGG
ncbi:MAG: synthase, subunit b [Actinomycetia bacterium]|nr:synthase, subunit b [Actinomycetes bacterium]